jgi:hypothetical protein
MTSEGAGGVTVPIPTPEPPERDAMNQIDMQMLTLKALDSEALERMQIAMRLGLRMEPA